MRRVYVTLTTRVQHENDSPEDRGEIVAVDWDSGEVVGRRIISGDFEIAQGRSRGATGMCWFDDDLWVATRTTVVRMDPDTLEEKTRLNFGKGHYPGIHQLLAYRGSIFVVCTMRGEIAKIQDGQVQQVRTVEGAVRPSDNGVEDVLHFNSMGFSGGREYHIYCQRPHTLYNYTEGRPVSTDIGFGPHGLVFLNPKEALTCSSEEGKLIKIDIDTGETETVFSVPVDREFDWHMRGFLRGFCLHPASDSLFVAASPNTIYRVDTNIWQEKGRVDFVTELGGSNYELVLNRRDWL